MTDADITPTTRVTSDPGPVTGRWRKDASDDDAMSAAWAIAAGGSELIAEVEG